MSKSKKRKIPTPPARTGSARLHTWNPVTRIDRTLKPRRRIAFFSSPIDLIAGAQKLSGFMPRRVMLFLGEETTLSVYFGTYPDETQVHVSIELNPADTAIVRAYFASQPGALEHGFVGWNVPPAEKSDDGGGEDVSVPTIGEAIGSMPMPAGVH